MTHSFLLSALSPGWKSFGRIDAGAPFRTGFTFDVKGHMKGQNKHIHEHGRGDTERITPVGLSWDPRHAVWC